MCDQEFSQISENYPLAWNSRFKWFGPMEFVLDRVKDGKFNNSKFVGDRYKNVVEYEVVSGLEHFKMCGHKEFMLDVRKTPLVKIKLFGLVARSSLY